jgi:Biotin synthase and related enzymes
MRKFLLFIGLSVFTILLRAQTPGPVPYIKDMQWGLDYQIHLTLFNDSSYTIKVDDMVHSSSVSSDSTLKGFVYYPVMLARDFVDKLKDVKTLDTSAINTNASQAKAVTLWSALHGSIGGGWVHFVNCLLYSLETRYLSLTAPLMERPKTSWKPHPMTEKYKRSRKWKYYVPVNQKQAQKEYKLKANENQLADLHDVPADFIKLFQETSQKDYEKLIDKHDFKKQARIDLVKLLLGSGYLGEPQITYIKTMVQKAVLQYSYNQLPTIIVFDDLEAAVVMSLNEAGYKLEKIVFRNANDLSEDDKQVRQQKIERTIVAINKVNQKVFEQRLKKHFNQ